MSANREMVAWQTDVATQGSNNFDDVAEAAASAGLRVQASRLFACEPDEIAGGSSCTELLTSIAWGLSPGRHHNVMSTDVAFPSTVYPWTRVSHATGCEIRLARGTDGSATIDDIVRLIDANTAAVSIPHIEYTSSQLHDLARLGEAAHEHGALLVVDASQSAGSIPIVARNSGADVILASAYKWLCGPFGAGVMWLSPSVELDPGIVGFRSHRDMWDLDPTRLEFVGSARRFEAGTVSFGAIKGLERSIQILADIGIEQVHDHNMTLALRLIDGLKRIGLGVVTPPGPRTPIVSCRVDDPGMVVGRLSDARVAAHKRQDFVRFSPHVYNSAEDIDRAVEALASAVAQ